MPVSYRFHQRLAGLLALSLVVLPPPASALFGAGDMVFDPSNFGQNVLTAARALQSNINEAMQIANQLRQIEMEVKNLASFPAGVWGRHSGRSGPVDPTRTIVWRHQLRHAESEHSVPATVSRLSSPDELPAGISSLDH